MRTLTSPIGRDVLLILDDLSDRFVPLGLFDLLNTLVWCKILLGSENPYLLLPELPKWRVITPTNPKNLQPTLVLVTRNSNETKREKTQSQQKSAWTLHQVRESA